MRVLTNTPDVIQDELARDEKLLWSGRPRQGIVLRASDAFFIPFSLLWGGFAIFWMGSVILSNAPVFFLLWGVPFVLLGLYMIAGRFFVDAQQRARTYYAVTDQRILVVSGLFSKNVKSLNLRTLSDVSLDQNRDGAGTIAFGPTHPYAWWYAGMSWPGTGPQTPRFELIVDAKNVYEIVRTAQRRGA